MDLTERDYLHTPVGTRQKVLTCTQKYDAQYIADRYHPIADNVRKLAERRVEVLTLFTGPPAGRRLLDYGCGSGEVVLAAERAGWRAGGCDIAPGFPARILPGYVFRTEFARPDVATFFDSLEHLHDPAETVARVGAETVMVSVPWCHYPQYWGWFGPWKHRRPGEHLHHWGDQTLKALFDTLGYDQVFASAFEDAYRPNPGQREQNILTCLFRRRAK